MTRRTRIKMCGTTNIEDAMVAVSLGVDALGFIFFEKSPRNVIPEVARTIIKKLPPFVDCVGVFVDRNPDEIVEITNYCGLNHLQLHGKETPDTCAELYKRLEGIRLVKAFRVGDDIDTSLFEPYEKVVDAVLLDTYVKGVEGGTGATFNWKNLQTAALENHYVVLAGGLTAENVLEAIKVGSPFAIDINSGVEKKPGIKDHDLLEKLIKNVRTAEA